MALECINPEDLPTPQTYTHVIVATGSRLVFVAGQPATLGPERFPARDPPRRPARAGLRASHCCRTSYGMYARLFPGRSPPTT